MYGIVDMGAYIDMDLLPSFEGIRDNLWSETIQTLLGAVGAYLMTLWIRRVKDSVPTPFLILIGVGIYTLFVFSLNQTRELFRRRAEPERVVTLSMPPEELQGVIRKWLDVLHVPIANEHQDGAYFFYAIRQTGGVTIGVGRPRTQREQFISVVGAIEVGADDQAKLKALSEREQQRIYMDMGIELMRQKIISKMEFPQKVTFESRLSINDLTQSQLLDRIDDIDFAIHLAVFKFRLLMDYGFDGCKNQEPVTPKSGKSLKVTSKRP